MVQSLVYIKDKGACQMQFSSLEFIFRFLPLFFICYIVIPERGRNLVLLFGSLVFYAVGEPVYIFLMIASILINYGAARAIWRNRRREAAAALAEQVGVAAEQEANFVGIRAATTCGDAVYAYSGWLFGYLHLSNAWYSVDPAGASEHYRTLSEPVRADLAANNEYWARWEGPAREAGEKVYTEFLKSDGKSAF